jgi:hypothetical protein
MRRFLLQDPGNTKWLAAQDQRRRENGSAAEIRRAAFPELSLSSRNSISIASAQERISKRMAEKFC